MLTHGILHACTLLAGFGRQRYELVDMCVFMVADTWIALTLSQDPSRASRTKSSSVCRSELPSPSRRVTFPIFVVLYCYMSGVVCGGCHCFTQNPEQTPGTISGPLLFIFLTFVPWCVWGLSFVRSDGVRTPSGTVCCPSY